MHICPLYDQMHRNAIQTKPQMDYGAEAMIVLVILASVFTDRHSELQSHASICESMINDMPVCKLSPVSTIVTGNCKIIKLKSLAGVR